MEGSTMIGVYEVVMMVLLLFPWSLILTVVIGATLAKHSALGRLRCVREYRGVARSIERDPQLALPDAQPGNHLPGIALTPSWLWDKVR
jgi:hypothetical protein